MLLMCMNDRCLLAYAQDILQYNCMLLGGDIFEWFIYRFGQQQKNSNFFPSTNHRIRYLIVRILGIAVICIRNSIRILP